MCLWGSVWECYRVQSRATQITLVSARFGGRLVWTRRVVRTRLCSPKSMFEGPQNVTIYGNWVFKEANRTSLFVQWLRVRLPMQGTQVQSLVQEDSTCFGATTKACALVPTLCRKRSQCNEKPGHCSQRSPGCNQRRPGRPCVAKTIIFKDVIKLK